MRRSSRIIWCPVPCRSRPAAWRSGCAGQRRTALIMISAFERLEEQIVDLSAQLGTVETMGQGGGGAVPRPAGGQFSGGGSGGHEEWQAFGDRDAGAGAVGAAGRDIASARTDRAAVGRAGTCGSLVASENPRGSKSSSPPGNCRTGAGHRLQHRRRRHQGAGQRLRGNGSNRISAVAVSRGLAGARKGTRRKRPYRQRQHFGGGSFDGNSGGGNQAPAPAARPPVRTAANSSPQAQALYEQSYNALVQRNYRAAGDGFEQFVQSYPGDPLAGSAFYWLGEAAFTSGEYRKAADSFLKSSTNYPQNEKAAESLLKLGISLKRLGENKAACSSLPGAAGGSPARRPFCSAPSGKRAGRNADGS